MNVSSDIRHDNLWSEGTRLLGMRGFEEHSPLRVLKTRDQALGMVRDCSVVLLIVGLVQISLSLLAGVGSSLDAIVYMPLAVLMYRFNSRAAATLLLGFAFFAVAVVVAGSVLQLDARTDLIVVAALLWASARGVEATRKLANEGSRAGRGWLAIAVIAFVVALVPRFLPAFVPHQIVNPGDRTSSPETTKPPGAAEPKSAPDGPLTFTAPTGFVEPRASEPAIATIAAGFVPPAMELAALFVLPADVESFRRDHQFAPTRYVMVQQIRKTADRSVSAEQFLSAKNDRSNPENFARLIGADTVLTQWMDAVLRPAGAVTELDGARVRSEGVIAESDRAISIGAVVEVSRSAGGPVTSQAVVTSLVLARGKVLVVYSYGTNVKSADGGSARDVAREVVRILIDENPV